MMKEMAEVSKKVAAKESKSKRIRRSPEILIKELDKKRKKLEERIYKSNKEFVHYVGAAVLKRADFDFSALQKQDIDDLANETPRADDLISSIIEKAHAGIKLSD